MLGHDWYVGGEHFLRDSEKVELPSVGLTQTLARFQFHLWHLKTGMPARLDGQTIDWDACVIQPSENPAMPFGHVLQSAGRHQPPNVEASTLIDCYKSATNEATIVDLTMIFVNGIIVHDVVDISSPPHHFYDHHHHSWSCRFPHDGIAVTIVIIPHGMMI
jgi:tRNA U34 5-carboxymethylaminomethyl modifying enzyme MnmG/GidA